MRKKKNHHFETKVIHAGQKSDPTTGAVMTPIVPVSYTHLRAHET